MNMKYKVVAMPLEESEIKSINEFIDNHGNAKNDLLNVLLTIQRNLKENYIGEEVAGIISEKLDIPIVQIYDVLTFYSMLNTEPHAKYIVELCTCAPCYLSDSDSVQVMVEDELQIKMGEHTEDWLFQLEECACVGACAIGPIIKIGDDIHGNLTREKIRRIFGELRAKKDL